MINASPDRCFRTSLRDTHGPRQVDNSRSSSRCEDVQKVLKGHEKVPNCWRIVMRSKRKAKSLQHTALDLGLQFSDANFNIHSHQPTVAFQQTHGSQAVHAYTEQNPKTIQAKQRVTATERQDKVPFTPIVGVGKKLQSPQRYKPKTAGSPFLKMRKRRAALQQNTMKPYRQPVQEPKSVQPLSESILGWQNFEQFNISDIVDYARRTMYSPMRRIPYERRVSSVNK